VLRPAACQPVPPWPCMPARCGARRRPRAPCARRRCAAPRPRPALAPTAAEQRNMFFGYARSGGLTACGPRRAGGGAAAVAACRDLLAHFEVTADQFQVGRTKLFFRAGVLGRLEDAAARINRRAPAPRPPARPPARLTARPAARAACAGLSRWRRCERRGCRTGAAVSLHQQSAAVGCMLSGQGRTPTRAPRAGPCCPSRRRSACCACGAPLCACAPRPSSSRRAPAARPLAGALRASAARGAGRNRCAARRVWERPRGGWGCRRGALRAPHVRAIRLGVAPRHTLCGWS